MPIPATTPNPSEHSEDYYQPNNGESCECYPDWACVDLPDVGCEPTSREEFVEVLATESNKSKEAEYECPCRSGLGPGHDIAESRRDSATGKEHHDPDCNQ
jgi:hypothetical protein